MAIWWNTLLNFFFIYIFIYFCSCTVEEIKQQIMQTWKVSEGSKMTNSGSNVTWIIALSIRLDQAPLPEKYKSSSNTTLIIRCDLSNLALSLLKRILMRSLISHTLFRGWTARVELCLWHIKESGHICPRVSPVTPPRPIASISKMKQVRKRDSRSMNTHQPRHLAPVCFLSKWSWLLGRVANGSEIYWVAPGLLGHLNLCWEICIISGSIASDATHSIHWCTGITAHNVGRCFHSAFNGFDITDWGVARSTTRLKTSAHRERCSCSFLFSGSELSPVVGGNRSTSQREGFGFSPWALEPFLTGVCMFSLCLCGIPHASLTGDVHDV